MPRKLSVVDRRALSLLGCAALISVLLSSCFERTTDKPCPSGLPFQVDGVCFPVQPDGYTPPPDMSVVLCSSAATCPASLPICDSTQKCAGCSSMGASTECAMYHAMTPLCGPNGDCVECLTKDNCDAKLETCKMNACAPCTANADCTSGLCNAGTGVCVDKSTLLYVNNAPTAGCSDSGTGAFAMPFCMVQKGLNAAAATGKTVIVFGGLVYAEALQVNTTLSGGNDYVATAIGVGNPVIKPTAAGPVLKVLGTATKQVTIAADGFTFENNLTDGSDGIDCGGGGAAYGKTVVNLVRSTVKGSSGVGIAMDTQCSLTADATIVTNNKQGGITLNKSDFTLTNLLVLSNGSPTTATAGTAFGGINVSAAGEAGKMNIANITLLGNKADNGSAGSAMLCPPATVKTINTVVFGNLPPTELQSFCIGTIATPQMTYSAYAGGSSMLNNIDISACAASLLFADPGNADYTPKKGNTPPCSLVDQGTNASAPDHDYKGNSRPQPAVGGKWDIGALEAL